MIRILKSTKLHHISTKNIEYKLINNKIIESSNNEESKSFARNFLFKLTPTSINNRLP